MLMSFAAIIAGLVLLVWSADKFVDGAVGIAQRLGMSHAMIGLTIVSLGTSAPEIFVSINAALSGASELAFGNAVGSNIANIGLVLGVTALVAALPVTQSLMREDLPALLIVTALVTCLLWDGHFSNIDALILLAALSILMALMIRYKKSSPEELEELEQEGASEHNPKKSVFDFILGAAVLVVSSRLLVSGAVDVASAFGVSEVVIGLTIVAIGTSLPELAASIASALRQHHDIALGNIVGSNILNLLAVLSAAALIHPFDISREIFIKDYGSMVLFTVALALFTLLPKKTRTLSKIEGSLLLIAYFGYLYTLYLRTL